MGQGLRAGSKTLVDEGVSAPTLEAQMAKVKAQLGIVEPSDLIVFPPDLQAELVADFQGEIANEQPPSAERLDERVIKEISEFKVEMWSNEGKHAGRPHVRVHLNYVISVSLDNEPENLTPSGGLVGEASALKIIKRNLDMLIELWNKTRPDTQRLKKDTQTETFSPGTKERAKPRAN
jgi:hypothetical protein